MCGVRLSAHITLLVTAATAIAVAGCGSSQTSSSSSTGAVRPSPSATSPATAACGPDQLVPAYAGTDGATGHMEVTIALRNVSSRACRISGYPRTRLIGSTGPLALRIADGGGFFPDAAARPRRIVIAPGRSAHYGVSFVTNNEYAGARVCHVVTGASAALPGHPGAWRAVSLHHAPRLAPCGSRITVSAIHA